ncbi:glycine zipper domain-containing protein [Thiocapsa sp.]|uniref:glycine zipper domain-containing protein n=1 Tax=Thiocapsa sp. TaxID=2024551 RepID=UPI002C4AA588|nr:glycine zipper domain-containing protein [Thiocapsa sp.]HSO84622.1 glycine zipper domain-containing protein [Thiocapsa sp.]
MKTIPFFVTAILAATLIGCGTTTASRTTSGAAAGAAAGAAIGSASANAGRGALIGAGVGALGAFAYDQHEKELQQQRDREAWEAQRNQQLYQQQSTSY